MADGPTITPVEIVRSEEGWTKVELANGMLVKAKLIITGVGVIEGQKDAFGNDQYMITHTIAMTPASPVKNGRAN